MSRSRVSRPARPRERCRSDRRRRTADRPYDRWRFRQESARRLDPSLGHWRAAAWKPRLPLVRRQAPARKLRGPGPAGARAARAAGASCTTGAVGCGETAAGCRAAGRRSSIQEITMTLIPRSTAIATAQIGSARRGGATLTSKSDGPLCRCRSLSDFFNASRMNDMLVTRAPRSGGESRGSPARRPVRPVCGRPRYRRP